jgi:predicted kinase
MTVLVAVSGLPGSGKSELARRLASDLHLPLFELDRLEAPLLRRGITGDQIGWGGYEMLTAVADLNLGLGLGVVIDSVAWTNRIREEWAVIARQRGAAFRPIEVLCSDPEIHLGRLRARWPAIPARTVVERMEQARLRYEAWEMPHLTLDSVNSSSEELMSAALAYLRTS